jgi:protein required for attachment to host cells
MTTTWILVANSGKATLFTADSPTAPLIELTTFDNPVVRLKQKDITSDRPGRSFDSHGEGRHAMAVEVSPKEQEQVRFAKIIVERLEKGRMENAFGRLVVVAAPEFLGMLRENYSAPLNSLLSLEIDKDYVSMNAKELRAQLPERL